LPIFNVVSMKEFIQRESWLHDVLGTFFLALGFSALVLALAGLYGVMSFTVTQRRRELSIRTALGAESAHLVCLVVRRGILQLASGLILGLALGLVIGIPMQSFLYGVKPRDPVSLGVVLAALAASGLLANLLPARRITKINAAAALGVE
jgi:ABC-type antimicrobial peptide transport system permease subunit